MYESHIMVASHVLYFNGTKKKDYLSSSCFFFPLGSPGTSWSVSIFCKLHVFARGVWFPDHGRLFLMCTPTLPAAATVLERAAVWLMLMLIDGWVQQAVEELWSPSLVYMHPNELSIFIFSQIRVMYAHVIGRPFVRTCHPWGVSRSDVGHCHDVSSNIHDILKVEVLHWILEGENSRGGSTGARVRQSLAEGEAAAASPLQRIGKGCTAVALWTLCVLTREALTSALQDSSFWPYSPFQQSVCLTAHSSYSEGQCFIIASWETVSDGISNRKGLQLITIIIVD